MVEGIGEAQLNKKKGLDRCGPPDAACFLQSLCLEQSREMRSPRAPAFAVAHVSTVLCISFSLIDTSEGPSCFSECIMAALMSFIEALE